MPFLLALNATVELRCGGQSRMLPLDEFYLGYQKKALTTGEFVAAVHLPLRKASTSRQTIVASYKISKRFDQDISAVCGAYAIDIECDRIVAARIAYGGMAAIPQRARHTEAALIGQPWSAATMAHAKLALARDYAPIGDMRASAGYRLQVAGNLLTRLYLEHSDGARPARIPLHLGAGFEV
jgi:xanthine dehydrogenase small subunit